MIEPKSYRDQLAERIDNEKDDVASLTATVLLDVLELGADRRSA